MGGVASRGAVVGGGTRALAKSAVGAVSEAWAGVDDAGASAPAGGCAMWLGQAGSRRAGLW